MAHRDTLKLLGVKPKLTFCRGDSKSVLGPNARRKPDVVIIREDTEQLRDSVDPPKGPESPFVWDDLYGCRIQGAAVLCPSRGKMLHLAVLSSAQWE